MWLKELYKKAPLIIIFSLFIACSSDSTNSEEVVADTEITDDNVLASLVATTEIKIDDVIACAAGSATNPNEIIAFVYPRPGTTDIRFYETESVEVDKNDFNNYTRINVPEEDFFNGYLKMFKRETQEEKWVIVTFFEGDVLSISNPIRLKHNTVPTEYTDQILINTTQQPGMPVFEWEDGQVSDNAIFFQVVSDATNELLSGTYTFERRFQYHVLDNVVLNITEETPPDLLPDTMYNFTIMGVSEDNWVNTFYERAFIN